MRHTSLGVYVPCSEPQNYRTDFYPVPPYESSTIVPIDMAIGIVNISKNYT
jgi:hypothetical protein